MDHEVAAAEVTMPDPFVLAIGLCQIAANAKTIEPALKRLRKLGRDIEKAEAKRKAITAEIEQKQAELAARAAELDGREAALDARKTEVESSLTDARDELREHHARLDDAHRQLIHRIMSCSGILAEWNPNLQSLPTWEH
jgi:chromosome segregation ATPase